MNIMKHKKLAIPSELEMAIVRIRATRNLDWPEACGFASKLLDEKEVEFKKIISAGLNKVYKKELMSQINKSKKTIQEKAYREGFEDAKNQFEIWYYCNTCSEKTVVKQNDNDHKAMIGYMREKGWGHKSCHEKT